MLNYTQYAKDYPDKDEMDKLLRRCENSGKARGIRRYNKSNELPARNFERLHHLEGISGDWKMPEGYTEDSLYKESMEKGWLPRLLKDEKEKLPAGSSLHHSLDDLIEKASAADANFHRNMYDQLVELNPELRSLSVNRNNEVEVGDVVWGCLSQFNKDDMAFFRRDSDSNHALRNEAEL